MTNTTEPKKEKEQETPLGVGHYEVTQAVIEVTFGEEEEVLCTVTLEKCTVDTVKKVMQYLKPEEIKPKSNMVG